MTLTDFGSFGNPFGGSGVGAGNPGAPSGFGGGESKLTGGLAPGTVSPFDQQAVGNALNLSGTAMANRYAQLGLSGQGATPSSPGGLAGGVGVGGGANWQNASPSQTPTAEQMDLGMLPSLGGGLTGEAEATLGQIQNANLAQASSGGSSGGGKAGGGGAGSALGALGAVGGK